MMDLHQYFCMAVRLPGQDIHKSETFKQNKKLPECAELKKKEKTAAVLYWQKHFLTMEESIRW